MCDFSVIQDLPKMYQHCKETEDNDLSIFEFFTDHLIDFDAIFEDKHQNHTEKPHQSNIQRQNNFCVQIVTPHQILIPKEKQYSNVVSQKVYCNYQINYSFIFNTSIFHPPTT
jgi:hypothetical protein